VTPPQMRQEPVWTEVSLPAPAASADTEAPAPPSKKIAKAVAFGLRSTQNRPQTVAEMAKKLRGRYPDDEDIVTAAIEQLKAAGALDDEAFARIWVDDRGHQRGYGAARLRQELRRRLVPEEIAEEALASLDDRDDLATAMELARKRARTFSAKLEPDAVARRLQGYLVRRGYNAGLANKVAIDVSGLDRYRSWD
jgi:regulatory protein